MYYVNKMMNMFIIKRVWICEFCSLQWCQGIERLSEVGYCMAMSQVSSSWSSEAVRSWDRKLAQTWNTLLRAVPSVIVQYPLSYNMDIDKF